MREGLLEEAHSSTRRSRSRETRARMAAFLASGGQDPVAELELGSLLAKLRR